MKRKVTFLLMALLLPFFDVNCFCTPSSHTRTRTCRISSVNQTHYRKSTSRLYLSSNPFLNSPLAITSNTAGASILMRAALTLVVSAGAGIAYDKKCGGGLGTLITLLIAAHASNLNLSPSHNVLFDFCWTTLLPSSLVLLLIASPSAKDQYSSRQEICAVALPFLIASIGSVLGCIFSFFLTLFGAMNSAGKRLWTPGRLLLPPIEGAVQAGCLCASFIGGPVNYFAVRHLLASSETLLGHDGGVLDSLFGSSISDLLVMAVYFSVSTTLLGSKRLQKWFPERDLNKNMQGDQPNNGDEAVPFSKRQRVVATLFAAFLAREMVKVSTAFGRTIHIPGFMTMSLAGLGAISSRLLPKVLSFFDADALMEEVRSISTLLSDVCFYLLFAAIGASANLREAVQLGGWHFASGALFASMALFVHIVTLIGGSLAVQRFSKTRLELEEILVASNAAIGGPVTAVEFANRTPRRRRGLIMAATVWGVAGFVIATEVGVTLTRLLLPLLPNQWQ